MGVEIRRGPWTDPGTGSVEPSREITYGGGDGGYGEDNVEPSRNVSYHPPEDGAKPQKNAEPQRVIETVAETPPPVKVDEPKAKSDDDDDDEAKAKAKKANKAKTGPSENKSR